jgi:hypothetical protein
MKNLFETENLLIIAATGLLMFFVFTIKGCLERMKFRKGMFNLGNEKESV